MIRKTGDKGTFYSGEKGTKKIGVDRRSILTHFGRALCCLFIGLLETDECVSKHPFFALSRPVLSILYGYNIEYCPVFGLTRHVYRS